MEHAGIKRNVFQMCGIQTLPPSSPLSSASSSSIRMTYILLSFFKLHVS